MENISVIIPTWNRANVIIKTIQSVINQSLKVKEIIVCDDCSDDDTIAKVNSLNQYNIRVIRSQKRSGLPAVQRNKGIKESTGDWIAFLDSDDEWDPLKLEKQINIINKTKYLAACSNAARSFKGVIDANPLLNYNKSIIRFIDLLKVNSVICSSVIVHKSLLGESLKFPEDPKLKAMEDYALWLRVSSFTEFAYLNEPLVIYNDDSFDSVRLDNPVNEIECKNRVMSNYMSWLNGKDYITKYKMLSVYYFFLFKQLKRFLPKKGKMISRRTK